MGTSSSPTVSLLILIPLLGSLVCLGPWFKPSYDVSGRWVRTWSGMIAGFTLFFTAIYTSLLIPQQGVPVMLEEFYPWIPSFGIGFSLRLDGISAVFSILTGIISLAVILWSSPVRSVRSYYALLLAAEGAVLGAFLATDLVLFYSFYELMLLPVIAGMAIWGGERRLNAALKFLVYTIAGSVLMLVAIIYIGWRGKTLSGTAFGFDITILSALSLFSPQEQLVLGLAFMLAFAVKIPMVPFHSWLPDAYREASHPFAAFIAALLGKVGIYGVIRFMWPLFPVFMEQYGYLFAGLGAIGVVYGALLAMVQKDIRSLLAYSSISHLGFCVLGLGSPSEISLTGVVFQSFSHGLITAGLFLVFGVLIDRQGSRTFDDFGGLAARLPRSAFLLMLFTVSAVALPLTSAFVGEFMILLGSFPHFKGWTIVALIGVILGAVYMLTAYLKIMFGSQRKQENEASFTDINTWDSLVVGALAAIVIIVGVWPAPILRLVEPAVYLTPEQPRILLQGGVGAQRLALQGAIDSPATGVHQQ